MDHDFLNRHRADANHRYTLMELANQLRGAYLMMNTMVKGHEIKEIQRDLISRSFMYAMQDVFAERDDGFIVRVVRSAIHPANARMTVDEIAHAIDNGRNLPFGTGRVSYGSLLIRRREDKRDAR